MGLNSLICWYQKKIGTYDKQLWEETVEQKIFSGLTHVPMKTSKFKTELIDVDFVRGSTYPKAKSKHGLVTVAYLAILRLAILPFTARWWIQQTSFCIYIFFLLLYGFQMLNICIYFNHYTTETDAEVVSITEVLIPAVMMLILSMVHSQIVSTNSGPIMSNKCDKQRTRRSRHNRSSLNKPRAKKSDSKETKSTQNDAVNSKVTASVRFAKNLINNTQTVSSNSNSIQGIDSEDCIMYSKVKLNLLVKTQDKNLMNNLEENQKNNIPQDDDGFESLNGNGSSDNDRESLSVINKDNQMDVVIKEKEENEGEKQDHYEDPRETCRKRQIFSDKELDDYDSPSSEHLSEQSLRDGRKNCDSEEEDDCEERANHLLEATTSDAEWMQVNTNRDECSYSSEFEESDCQSDAGINYEEYLEYPFSCEFDVPPSVLLSPCASHEKVSCTIWTHKDVKKAELSVLDISYAIISKVESMSENLDNFYSGLILAVLLSLVPSFIRVSNHFGVDSVNSTVVSSLMLGELSLLNHETLSDVICEITDIAFGSTWTDRLMIFSSAVERFVLSSLLFFLLAVAERTYKQRLLYAKLFSHLTSSRRARKSDLPHFRLNKVRNIKTWLSVRSHLKRRGPQRSVDIIVSSVFIITLILLSFVSFELIKDLDSLHSHYNIEAIFWSFALGIFILRFMTLGTKINKKYRNLSVLITEQINLYLQIEQKPHKKEELMVANSVLKLAADLIKELESPFKISGLSANPYLYTITKVVLLSALSGVFSELLGFKLKLHKIKIK